MIVDAETQSLPNHIEETIRSIAKLQAAHEGKATPLQHGVNRLTAFIGRPKFLLLTTGFILLWIGANLGARLAGMLVFDPPPYNWLQGLLALAAVYVTTLILTTQRYADQLAGYREQLTLELAILTEQKTSKLIELLEEQRRDNPQLRDRADPQAEAMKNPANPEAVLDAIKDAHEEFETSLSDTVLDPSHNDDRT